MGRRCPICGSASVTKSGHCLSCEGRRQDEMYRRKQHDEAMEREAKRQADAARDQAEAAKRMARKAESARGSNSGSCSDADAGCLVAILLAPFRPWFWKYVVPIILVGGVVFFFAFMNSLMDGDANKYLFAGMRGVKEKSLELASQGDETAAGKLICGVNLKGYDRFVRERKEVDDKIIVTRFFPAKPDIYVSGFVESVDGLHAVVALRNDESKVSINVNFSAEPNVKLKIGDFVTLDGTASNMKSDSFTLNNVKVASVGVKEYWQ